MSGRPEEGLYDNEEIQAPTVPQGYRRRARSEFEGDTDHFSATRRRVEEARRPQRTMRSTVKDILLEGSTLRNNMKLNEFLRNHVGGRGVVDTNENVAMEMFVQDPEMFIQNERLLRIITTTPSYQALEAINKLHHEDVDSLEQWRDYERKDTVTPFAREKLNAALTQVLTEERREAEERARREEQVIFNLFAKIEDLLFGGRVRVMDIKLNDFLTLEMEGRGILRSNRNVLLRDFISDPTRYIREAGVLKEIQASGAYARMEKTVREEMDLEEVVRKLYKNGVSNLLGWSLAAAEVKATVHNSNKHFLDAAAEEARNLTTTIEAMKLEGLYESVHNASWHHVVEVPEGEGTGVEVRDGEPPRPWTYKAVGRTFEKNDGVEQSGAERLKLMVLTSDKGWPYRWGLNKLIRDCYVNSEVDRVWQIVKGGLTGWFSSHDKNKISPDPFVLIGTPGIGKSMNAGSYLLYQLLQYDAKRLQMVAYIIAEKTFLFDKTAKTVKKCSEASNIVDILDGFSGRGFKGYIIYDVAMKGHEPSTALPCKGWGMIVVTSPNKNNYESWAKLVRAKQIIINCPDESDVRAMCIWKEHNGQLAVEEEEEEADYWKKVNGRMDKVGPLLRYIFDDRKYIGRIDSCKSKVKTMNLFATNYYSILGTNEVCDDSHISHKLVKVVRLRGGNNLELPYNALVSSYLGNLVTCKLAELMVPNDFNLLVLAIKHNLLSKPLEKHSVFTFLSEAFVNAIIPKLRELKPEKNAPPHLCALRVYPHERPLKPCIFQCLEKFKKKINMKYGVLYKPVAQNFPLVDAFFFVDSNPKTLVGLQITTAGGHRTIASTVRQFNECLAAYFNVWEELSRDMSWEIIYVQHADSTPMNEWQRCDVVNTNKLSPAEKKIVAFWEKKVHQYQVSVSSRDFPREESPPTVEEQQQQETD
ncbi:putative retrotransposon hot spot (RHS) protein [Trypanosoma cruzi]|uniref:Retrotransposon hot spot (RHS) protein, putative n=2 Tax=Trypanosoma cruzi TaxID=5693 RepID=Q4D2I5_TRYCC|nr:retrotransposon hot spot (RHS) protein, putative [Trypanosoma cruzi]EAN86737.1 retrotransposon hot spot (RHS) protein, putative [Trypanosoma cruzi]PWV07073.1 putative retrotransposon hot spot (RHS) protein [Trypanosoma cruzi]RNC42259.1 putative retrotransposon hot spot (RHS) protein [Trypanosoma cruzi]|eukprot:XP_808588.1 retrotransposon hot spot (RHS) protein [Trypanosoma cruzi strain CL Brener]